MTTAPELLWEPSPERVAASRMAAFRAWLREERGLDVSDYRALWEWSVADLPGFWSAIAEFFDVTFHERADEVLAEEVMPGARWFPGATLNYAEHALRDGEGKGDEDLAVVFVREDGRSEEISYGELRNRVSAARSALAELGVGAGDRVAALAPNSPETLVAFLASASLGATWSSCSPDFGARAVADRFVQIEPKVLIAVDGYCYGGRRFDVRETVDQLRSEMPGLATTVLIDYLGEEHRLPGALDWSELLADHRGAALEFTPVPFDHPLWILYSSGTTGLPKGIVHGHGGMVLEHLKAIGLHCDLGPGDRFFWFTTTGWMMWNFLIGGLLTGTTLVLFDGSPGYPSLSALWELAARYRVNFFGTSAPYIQSCLKRELRPEDDFDLSALRAVGSTGAPLTTDGFRWVADAVGADVQIASVSGGTDLCTAFVGASPDVPVWLGEISCPLLGAAAASYDEFGEELHEEVGELVLTKPMPTMPVFFWDDPDGSRLRESYFDTFPGVWRHGDWVRMTDRGSLVIYGRSDSTLNRGGIRMGTAEFYRVVEGFEQIADSLVIDTSGAGETDGELLCFLVLAEGVELADVLGELKAALRTELSPRHVPNRFIVVDEVPRTLNGKKLEVPVKKILAGTPPERAVSRDALQNPASLDPFVQLSKTARE
ncbi:acetoacetate--CoA ligase [Saccharopolyspora karakumensis]|uniref:Acetoacetate--CoA ligase n=1 Tax=Saccharopolyspora karakumensis TaxID=2530386 RepID=A0A4R5C0U0_9PSEU|nr:acetoacetate--CoA ligase [Saccharopolyspora karakumensis]TDD90302.1 acetoacetate--CoA ligase [Saccharopolyspora karakumensis]